MARGKGRFRSDKEMLRALSQRQLKERFNFIQTHKCHWSLSFFAPAASVPVFLALTYGARSLMYDGVTIVDGAVKMSENVSFQTGGLLFFTDLLQPDTTLILPVVRFLMAMASIELNALRMDSPTIYMRGMMAFLRVVTVWMLFVSTVMPSGIVYYWFLSSLLALIQQVLMMQPRVLRFFNIPVVERHAYKAIAQQAKHRYRFFLRPFGLS